jgi:Ser/Thr protein kinase RdoA (MazF antagonist)
MEKHAEAAIKLWEVEPVAIAFLGLRENHIFRISTKAHGDVALRLHRPGYRSQDEVESELQWMLHLVSRGSSVPRPLMSRNARAIESYEGRLVDVLTWLPGEPLGRSNVLLGRPNTPKLFHKIGVELAKLHHISDEWKKPETFTRPHWNIDGLLGQNPLWGRFWENPALSARERDLLLTARDKAQKRLTALAGTLDYGLIHADLARENILVSGDAVNLIDFDDSGLGFRVFDLAVALFRNRIEPDFDQLKASLLQGYLSERHLDIQLLDIFMMIRALSFVGWIVPRMEGIADASDRNRRFITEACELATSFLDSA